MTQSTEELIYSVPDVSCNHCRAAITGEVEKLPGVASVDVDLEAKRTTNRSGEVAQVARGVESDEVGAEDALQDLAAPR